MPKDKKGFLKKAVKEVKKAGIKGDTELAHVNPKEKKLLKDLGGAGTRNSKTGLLQYYDGEPGMGSEGSGTTGAADGGYGGADVGGVDPAASEAAAQAAIDAAAAGGIGLGGLGGFGAEPGFGTDPGFADTPMDQEPEFQYQFPNLTGLKAQAKTGHVANTLGTLAGMMAIAANPMAAPIGLAMAGLQALGAEPDEDQSPKGQDPEGIGVGTGQEKYPVTPDPLEEQTNQAQEPAVPVEQTQTPAPIQEQQNQITQSINAELNRYYDRFGDGGPPRVNAYVDPNTGMVKYKYITA